MGYTPHEFQVAFDKANDEHSITFTKAQGVAQYFSSLLESNKRKSSYEKRKFTELIRLALNEKGIWVEVERKAYASLIGHLYSRRAHMARKHQSKQAVPRKALILPPPPPIILMPNGQLAWEI
ncbi:MAG: hypothetical protein KBC62_02180 [Candidatus Pacebacteria bacterium]|nr:hypothetical protein [Candidatus Paceibacterota bacterium]MBP9842790.1 hypothetical protein [Candidatus Paceibacterota bacterium]